MPHLPCKDGDNSSELDRYCSAVDIAQAIVRRRADDRYRMRAFYELIRGAQEMGGEAIQLIADEPPPTGDRRFDALLGAAAEYIAARIGEPAPTWADDPCRFLDTEWWVSDLPSARSYARTGTPPAFKRRGIWLDEYDLSTA
jgi:hypothetical protein